MLETMFFGLWGLAFILFENEGDSIWCWTGMGLHLGCHAFSYELLTAKGRAAFLKREEEGDLGQTSTETTAAEATENVEALRAHFDAEKHVVVDLDKVMIADGTVVRVLDAKPTLLALPDPTEAI